MSRLCACEWYVARFPGTKCEVISLHRANRVNLATHRLNAAAGGVVEATAYRSYRFAPIDLTARVSPLHADRNWQAARHPKPPLEKPLLRPRVRSTDRSRTTHCYEIPSATTDYRSLLFLDCVLFMGLFILICGKFAYHSHSRSINSYFSRTNEITASLVSIDECLRWTNVTTLFSLQNSETENETSINRSKFSPSLYLKITFPFFFFLAEILPRFQTKIDGARKSPTTKAQKSMIFQPLERIEAGICIERYRRVDACTCKRGANEREQE